MGGINSIVLIIRSSIMSRKEIELEEVEEKLKK